MMCAPWKVTMHFLSLCLGLGDNAKRTDFIYRFVRAGACALF